MRDGASAAAGEGGRAERMPARSSRRPRTELTVLHAADLHIGHHAHPDAVLSAFSGVIELARTVRADAVLIAGDLFDAATVPAAVVEYVFEALERLGRPVVILPGNHDTLLTLRDSELHGYATNHVRVLQGDAGEMVTLSNGLTVWGRPVYEHVPEFRPLEGLPPRPDEGWYVPMAHGIVTDGRNFRFRASPILEDELAMADCDYLALGHVHVFRDVTRGTAPAFYSGASVNGSASTAAVVTLRPDAGVLVSPIAVPYTVGSV